jgi:hypothetical protein
MQTTCICTYYYVIHAMLMCAARRLHAAHDAHHCAVVLLSHVDLSVLCVFR